MENMEKSKFLKLSFCLILSVPPQGFPYYKGILEPKSERCGQKDLQKGSKRGLNSKVNRWLKILRLTGIPCFGTFSETALKIQLSGVPVRLPNILRFHYPTFEFLHLKTSISKYILKSKFSKFSSPAASFVLPSVLIPPLFQRGT